MSARLIHTESFEVFLIPLDLQDRISRKSSDSQEGKQTRCNWTSVGKTLALFAVFAPVACRAVAAVGVPLADTHAPVLTHLPHAEVFLCRTTLGNTNNLSSEDTHSVTSHDSSR